MIWETVHTSSRTYEIPGDWRRVEAELRQLLKRLYDRRYWWRGRKIIGFQLRYRGQEWTITLKSSRTDEPLDEAWLDIESTVARLRKGAVADH